MRNITTNYLVTELKYFISIIGYILVVYPIKRFIYPILTWVIQNAYLFGMILFCYIGLYLYNWDLSKIANDLTIKLFSEDIWVINQLITPFIIIGEYPISLAVILLSILTMIVLIKIYELIKLLFKQIKQVLGDVLLVTLWCYYKLLGKQEESVMLISGSEAKIKLYMYAIIFIVIVISASVIIIPKLLFNPTTISTPLIINNTSIDLQPLQWVIP
ncbi:MAG: hypothetical protein MUO73_05220 [Thermoplasmata archaeon]|nr:hypothetical protein [Thermoplasmata archaeon]